MTGKRQYRSIFLRTLAAFLAFWLLMALVLTFNNLDKMRDLMENAYDGSSDLVPVNTKPLMEAGIVEENIGTLTWWQYQSARLGGACLGVTRIYDADGAELARSPISIGWITEKGMGTAEVYLLFDPVLDDDGQISLVNCLRKELDGQQWFMGSASGEINIREGWPNVGLYGEVTGILEGDVMYPKSLTYYYEDSTVKLMESDHEMFEDAELTTIRFDYANVCSAISSGRNSPKRLLKLYYRANELVDNLLEDKTPRRNWSGTYVADNGKADVSAQFYTEILMARSYAYTPWRMATYGLWPLYILTFLAALLAAVATSRAQIRTLKRERQFTRAVAHEFKTPAAVLRAYAEALGEDIAPEKRQEYLSAIVEETDRMGVLVNELLELSRLEGASTALTKVPVELDELVRTCFERLRLPMEGKGLALSLELEPHTVQGDPKRLEQMVNDLAVNVLHHAGPGAVLVKLFWESGRVVLITENRCAPIPEEKLKQLWEPFYKGDGSRSGEGSGLGLAVVKHITQLHGGVCRAENLAGGVRFRVELSE